MISHLNIDIDQLPSEYSIQLIDINGKVLFIRNNLNQKNVILLDDIERGIYYLILFEKEIPKGQIKLVKQRN